MRIIPVLDLASGRAVHARGGDRASYAPVRSVLADAPGDALALARACAADGAREMYVADLDAIAGGPPQLSLLRALSQVGPSLLVDAGVGSVDAARALHAAGATCVVVGLETLCRFADLDAIVFAVGGGAVAFSLDLRNGVPMARPTVQVPPQRLLPWLAARAEAAGVRGLIVLDLARVGSGAGPDLTLLGELRRALPDLELLVGGGVRDHSDLARLAAAGCDGALVGTAIHEGKIRLSTEIP